MSAIPNAFSAPAAGATRQTTDRLSELSNDQFIRIMFTELTNQDPFQPNDSQALLQQISAIRSIQSDMELTSRLDAMVQQNQLAAAGNLIGRYVAGRAQGGEQVEGYVLSVSSTREGPILNLDNNFRVFLKDVQEMTDPSLFL